MSDKDQFTFEDDEDFPETNLGDKNESQGSDLSDEVFPKTSLDDQNESEKPVLDYEASLEGSFDDQKLDEQEESPGLDLSYEDDFPETDLGAAFSEGELVSKEEELDEPESKVKGSGNSRTRVLLIVMLLVIAGGAGAYYFMGLGGTTPSVPTVPVPAQKTTKSVALPAKAAQAPAAPVKVEPTAKPVTVAVPPPPAEPAPKISPTKKSVAVVTPPAPPAVKSAEKVVATKPKVEPAKQPVVQVALPAPQPKVVEAKATTTPAPVPVPQKAVASVPSAASTKAPVPTKQVVGGAFTLDAGSYLFEANRDSLVAQIKGLGYEPLVTPVDATLDMTRLRLGTFSKDEVQEALDFARSIEPGAYSAPAGDGYVLYAGTFLKAESIDKLRQRYLNEGVKTYPEPVQVVRTLSRIRFGSFTTKEAATAVASELNQSGLKSVVVKSK